MGLSSMEESSFVSHTCAPVAVLKARKRLSSVPPRKVRPLAVVNAPLPVGRPVFWYCGANISDTPTLLSQTKLPVFILTATSSPQGVGPQSRWCSTSPKRRRPASGPWFLQLPSGPCTSRIGWNTLLTLVTKRLFLGSKVPPQKFTPPAGPGGDIEYWLLPMGRYGPPSFIW